MTLVVCLNPDQSTRAFTNRGRKHHKFALFQQATPFSYFNGLRKSQRSQFFEVSLAAICPIEQATPDTAERPPASRARLRMRLESSLAVGS